MFDCWSKIKRVVAIFKGKFSSEEIESQYNLIKMFLVEPEQYRDAINSIKKDIASMPIALKKNLRKKILSYEWIANGIHHDH